MVTRTFRSHATDHDTFAQSKALYHTLADRMGWDEEALQQINDPSYPALKDLDVLIETLDRIRTSGTHLVILPDFDMDGISSGILGYAGLCELGFNVSLYVPDYRTGHDLGIESFQGLKTQFPTAEYVITCDAGVNSHEGIEWAVHNGLKVLVTDHHLQLEDKTFAEVVVDPERVDETYPHPAICGAFVLYQVLEAFTKRYSPEKIYDIQMLRLFAGLGTVGDVMPLLYENRKIVRDSVGLAKLFMHVLPPADLATPYDIDKSALMPLVMGQPHHPAYVNAFRGFAMLLRGWREQRKIRTTDDINNELYGFYFAPMFNAIRRVEGDLGAAFTVFTTDDDANRWMAVQLIIQYNEYRRSQSESWLEDLKNREQPLAPHVWLTEAPSGMLGLMAGKLCQEYQIPVVVCHYTGNPADPIGGSARSPEWFDIITELTTRGFFAIGHEHACGVRAGDLDQMTQIAQLMAESTEEVLLQLELLKMQGLAPLEYDLLLDAGIIPSNSFPESPDGYAEDPETLVELFSRIDLHRPFGMGFPQPRVRLRVNLAECSFKVIGEDQTHLSIGLSCGMKLLWFGGARFFDALVDKAASPLNSDKVIVVDTYVSVNEFMGVFSPQATIQSVQNERALLED